MGIPVIQVQAMALEAWGFAPPEEDIKGKYNTASMQVHLFFPLTWNFLQLFVCDILDQLRKIQKY